MVQTSPFEPSSFSPSSTTKITGEYAWAGLPTFGAASLVGLSVIKRGWHWPSDVVAGAVLGVVIGRTSLSMDRERGFVIGPTQEGCGLVVSGVL